MRRRASPGRPARYPADARRVQPGDADARSFHRHRPAAEHPGAQRLTDVHPIGPAFAPPVHHEPWIVTLDALTG
jgi:hypothetical protein